MRSAASYQTAGWCVPVPVRPSSFTPLLARHKAYNIEVDLGRITPFGYPRGKGQGQNLLYADLQTSPTGHGGRRLGSGRAGFYKGKYLKGVGRTFLAGNWNDPADVYHGTGHMMPSAAVREYIVSQYLAARGFSEQIVACEGLLLSPLHKDLRGFHRLALPGLRMSPIDLRFQAITIKGSDFARHSNFVWALDKGPRKGFYGAFFRDLYQTLCDARLDPCPEPDPAGLAAALAICAQRGLRNFECYLRAGVYWGSFHNNFTIDGRFLDLEVPLIFGRPFFGIISQQSQLTEKALHNLTPVIGCEALEFLLHTGRFVVYLQRRLRSLLDEGSVMQPVEREFVEEFLAALGREFHDGHAAMNKLAACNAVTDALTTSLGLFGAQQQTVRSIVSAQYESCVSQRAIDLSAYGFRRLALPLAKVESSVRYHAFCPDFLDEKTALAPGRYINQALSAIDRLDSIDAIFQAVEELAAEVKKLSPCTPGVGSFCAREQVLPGADAQSAQLLPSGALQMPLPSEKSPNWEDSKSGIRVALSR